MPLKPPPHPQPVKAGLERLGVYGTKWALGAAIAGVCFYAAGTGSVPPLASNPAVDGALPLQQWSAGIDLAPRVIGSAVAGGLPAPDPRQRKPPCDPDLERELNGFCWVPVDVRPCPKNKAWVHDDGKCYAYALNAARLPSTGEIRPGNVAGGAK